MNAKIADSILVLDDDETFRTFVCELLKSRGLNVIPAKTVREANALLGSQNPMLAIIDYRLPESDGMTWITRLREAGKNFPIVFLSGIWCDEKTFDWLRNILRVSLILQKPIMPQLFVQQIESLLPATVIAKGPSTIEASTIASCDSTIKVPLLEASPQSSPTTQSKLAALRDDYANGVGGLWQELGEAIHLLQEAPGEGILKKEAIQKAHKIRGTAGSIGFIKLGEVAGKIEDLLIGFDPEDALSQVVWSEINRALPLGEDLANAAKDEIQKKDNLTPTGSLVRKILLVGNKENYSQYIEQLGNKYSSGIEIAESVIGARAILKAHQRSFEAAILDIDCVGGKEALLEIVRDIRRSETPKCLPIALIAPSTHKLKTQELAYAGISVIINKERIAEELELCVKKILNVAPLQAARILLVDDDETLTKLLTEILSMEGMIVQSLHKPIKIISAVKTFRPDLVLLDVEMQGLSGYDVCRILRATDEWQRLPVLFLTARSDQVSRAAAFQAGGTDFLNKPVVFEEVLARVRSQLQNVMVRSEPVRDELTGLLNRGDFISAAGNLLLEAEGQNKALTLCLLNIDDFMKSSFQHGWFSMQTVLSTFGELLNSRFKSQDLRGRLAEDTFALAFLSEDKETVAEVMTMLRTEFADTKFSSENVGYFKTIFNVGLAEYPGDGSTITSLLEIANHRLMSIKLQPLR